MCVSVRMCQPHNKQPQVPSFFIASARAGAQGLAPCGHLETPAPFLPCTPGFQHVTAKVTLASSGRVGTQDNAGVGAGLEDVHTPLPTLLRP